MTTPGSDAASSASPSAERAAGQAPVLALALRLALLLVGGVLASALIAISGVSHGATWSGLALNVVVVVVDVITLAILARTLTSEGSSLSSLFGKFRPRDAGVGLGLGLLLLVAFLAATFLANLAVYQGPPPLGTPDPGFRVPLWFGLWCVVVMPVTIALAEEAWYRGYLQPRWSARIGTWPGLLVVALAFGLQHVAFALASPQAATSRVLATFAIGVLFGVLFRKVGRLWPLVVAHWLVDVVGLGLPLLAASLAG